MFRILCDPSAGTRELCLNEIASGDSQIFLSCAWSVFGSIRCQTPTNCVVLCHLLLNHEVWTPAS